MLEDLLEANRRYAADFTLDGIPARAAKGIAIVTCMDSRIEPLAMLGLLPGDAKILRNAGGRVTSDVLRSLILACAMLNVTEIAVIQHTDCALANRSNDDLRSKIPLAQPTGDATDYLAMPDPDHALRTDVEAVTSCPLLPGGVRVEGWRYDVASGTIQRIIAV